MSQGRQEGLSGYLALSWQDMAQWASLTISAPSGDEWRMLRAMDMAFLAAKREQQPNPQGEADPPKVSSRTLSPNLFDALVK